MVPVVVVCGLGNIAPSGSGLRVVVRARFSGRGGMWSTTAHGGRAGDQGGHSDNLNVASVGSRGWCGSRGSCDVGGSSVGGSNISGSVIRPGVVSRGSVISGRGTGRCIDDGGARR